MNTNHIQNRRRFLQTGAALSASLAGGVAPLFAASNAKAIDADLLLKGGTIYDGTGAEGVVGDVAIRGKRIVAVGKFKTGKIGRVINCRGLIVSPGFIDLHTHWDRSVFGRTMRKCLNYIKQGCTTCVSGNCGLGPSNTKKFLDKVDKQGIGLNLVHLIPHGPVRQMGMKNAKRPANAEEIERMQAIIDDAMRAGAWGMSTGLEYDWSGYADTHELVELCKTVSRHGGFYATHLRNQSDKLCEAISEAIEIGKQANLPAHVSHIKAKGVPYWGKVKDAIALIEQARERGQKVTADNYPYTVSCTCIEATLLPEASIPGGRANMFQRMESDPAFDKKVRQSIQNQLDASEKLVIVSCKKKEWKKKSIEQLAKELGVGQVDVALKLLKLGPGGTALRYAMSEDDIRTTLKTPWIAISSDGWGYPAGKNVLCHPRNFGAFARAIGRYAIREKVIPVPQAIRQATGLPADILGMDDRGYLRPDAYADIVVFDPKTFFDRATFDTPAVYATGVKHLLIAGSLAIDNSRVSEERYGRSIRHRSSRT